MRHGAVTSAIRRAATRAYTFPRGELTGFAVAVCESNWGAAPVRAPC